MTGSQAESDLININTIGEIFDLEKNNSGYCYTDDTTGEVWHLKPYNNLTPMVSLSLDTDSSTSLVFSLKEILGALESGTISELISKTKHQKIVEKKGHKEIAKYELPDIPAAHIRVFPKAHDHTVASNVQSSMLFGATLERRYPKMSSIPIVFTDDPETALTASIQKQYEAGKRLFLVDIYNHGSEEEVLFKNPLKARHLAELAAKYPDAKFQTNTIACFGGGLQKGIEQEILANNDIKKQVSVFTQAKPHTPNFAGNSEAMISSSDTRKNYSYSTHYYLHLMKGLQSGMKYGEAHVSADIEAKKSIQVDAEATWQGKLYVNSKSNNLENLLS